ncbi:MAG TPA: hypothetical protein DDY49_10440, partial [Paenibacillaceae bacterium]|nr:hypothetical protein [Paenibacillaceae bacterium]
MIIDTFVHLGTFSGRTSIFATLLSIVLFLISLKILPRKLKHHFGNETLDLFFSLFIVFIIAWKVSPLLIQPDLWKKPMILIYAQGIGTEIWLASIITLLFFMWKIWKKKLPILKVIDSLTIAIYLFLFFYSLFVYSPGKIFIQIPINIYREIVIISFLIYLYKTKPLASGFIGAFGLITIGVLELILSLLKAETNLLIYYLSLSQWFAFLCLSTGIYL